MKRILFTIAVLVAIVTTAGAQSTQRQKVIHMAALRIAGQIGVRESDTDQFVSLYQAYKKDLSSIMDDKPAVVENAEQTVENKILSDFDKSERILKVRRSYYVKFRKILQPSQIRQMYGIEKSAARN